MSIGVLIITHRELGQQLVEVASMIFAAPPENLACYGMRDDYDPDAAFAELQELRASLDCADGLLVLTDLYGATPYNLSRRLLLAHPDTTLISGVNLPMVVNLFNMQRHSRSQLAESLASNARMGAIIEVGEAHD